MAHRCTALPGIRPLVERTVEWAAVVPVQAVVVLVRPLRPLVTWLPRTRLLLEITAPRFRVVAVEWGNRVEVLAAGGGIHRTGIRPLVRRLWRSIKLNTIRRSRDRHKRLVRHGLHGAMPWKRRRGAVNGILRRRK